MGYLIEAWKLFGKFLGPALTALIGVLSLLDPKRAAAKVVMAVLIVLSGLVSAYAIQASIQAEAARARDTQAKYESTMDAIDRIGDAVDIALDQQDQQNRQEQLTGQPTRPAEAQETRAVLERAATELKTLRRAALPNEPR